MHRHPYLLDRATCALVVVDMQERFLAAMNEGDRLEANVSLLCHTARLLNLPALATTQYAQRMGPVLPSVLNILGFAPEAVTDKLTFSCAGSEPFMQALRSTGCSQVLLCGLETHICISQTAHDLLHAGFQVHVAADAVSSRTLEKHKLGMERIRDSGIRPCASEAAVYELLYQAGTGEFREILKLVR